MEIDRVLAALVSSVEVADWDARYEGLQDPVPSVTPYKNQVLEVLEVEVKD